MNGLYDPDNLARPDFSQMVPFKPKVDQQKKFCRDIIAMGQRAINSILEF